MPSEIRPGGVHVIDAARFNAMQAVCDCARIWNRSKGEEKSRAERALLHALTAYEHLPAADEEE